MFVWLILLVVVFVLLFSRRIFYAIVRILNWMLINGYLFPKTMRADRERNLKRIDALNKQWDEIIENRSMRG